MVLKAFGVVAFFAGVRASFFCNYILYVYKILRSTASGINVFKKYSFLDTLSLFTPEATT
jgi:hypothetical protein